MQLRFILFSVSIMLAACKSEVTLPIERSFVNIDKKKEETVCIVRTIAKLQDLSFHFGTSDQSFGSMNTFRLIGDGYEITMVNPESATKYELRAYNKSGDAAVDVIARSQFEKFKQQLLIPRHECTN